MLWFMLFNYKILSKLLVDIARLALCLVLAQYSVAHDVDLLSSELLNYITLFFIENLINRNVSLTLKNMQTVSNLSPAKKKERIALKG